MRYGKARRAQLGVTADERHCTEMFVCLQDVLLSLGAHTYSAFDTLKPVTIYSIQALMRTCSSMMTYLYSIRVLAGSSTCAQHHIAQQPLQ